MIITLLFVMQAVVNEDSPEDVTALKYQIHLLKVNSVS